MQSLQRTLRHEGLLRQILTSRTRFFVTCHVELVSVEKLAVIAFFAIYRV